MLRAVNLGVFVSEEYGYRAHLGVIEVNQL